jgi:hypothetical protein
MSEARAALIFWFFFIKEQPTQTTDFEEMG